MKKLFILLIGMILFVTANAQTPQLNWAKNYDGPVNAADRITDADFDPATGYTYVTGVSDSTVGYNYVTIKYSSAGQIVWRKRYSGPQYQDSPNAIKYDPVNNAVYVTGKSKGKTSNFDWLTIRYNAATGDTVWTHRYNGTQNGNDEAIDLDIDASGNVYVLGNVLSVCSDHLTTKLTKYSLAGVVAWTQSIDDNYCRYDELASKVAVNGNKVVAIYNEYRDSYYYAYANGYFISSGNCTDNYCRSSFIGMYSTSKAAYGIAFNGLGNIYLSGGQEAGTSGYMQVTKLNTDVYSKEWAVVYGWDKIGVFWANNIIVDQNNYNFYVTGYSQNSSGNKDIITIKYNNSGDTIWTKRFNGTGNRDDIGMFIAKDNLSNPNIFVTGFTTQASGKKQITTIKYDNDGNQLWSIDYGCSTNDNVPASMFRDPNNNIYIAGYNNCNSSDEDYLTLKYCPPAPVQSGAITGSSTVCGGSSQTYTISPVTGAISYIWTLPTGATGTSTTNSITVNYSTSAVSGNITVRGHNDCADGAISTLAITVNPLPANAGTISGTTTVCQGSNTITYTVPAIENATSYIWTLPNGVSGISTTNSISVIFSSSSVSGNITVKGHNSCGDGALSTLAITVNSVPASAGIVSGNATVCQGQKAVNYTVPLITNATSYIWTLPDGVTGTSTTNTINVDYGMSAVSGGIEVYGKSTCGDGSASIIAVTVNPSPAAAGSISGSATVCQGENSISYSVPTIANATSYIWTLPSGASGTSSTKSIIVNYGASAVSGDITVKGQFSCGDGASSTLAVTVNPLPANAGTISGNTTVCQGQNSVLYAAPTIANATSYIWTLPAGATGNSSTKTIVVNYGATAVSGNITVKGNNSCGDGAISTLPVVVNATPATPIVTLNNNILHSTATTGNQWYNKDGLIGGANTRDYTPTTSGDYYVIVSVNGCISNLSNSEPFIPTGIAPTKTAKSIKVYPNPVTNELVIEIVGNTVKTDFEVLNSIGQVVFNGNLIEKTVVQTSSFFPGVYLIKLESGSTFEFKKIIKK